LKELETRKKGTLKYTTQVWSPRCHPYFHPSRPCIGRDPDFGNHCSMIWIKVC